MAWYIDIGLYLFGLFKIWLSTLFVAPFKNMDMLWLLIPIWISWFFAEFFQEKTGTSMGNAITNAVVVLWGSIDCSRQTLKLMHDGLVAGFANVFARFSLIVVLFGYGITIVILGWKGNKIIKYIGRVREVTYVFAIFTPVFYNAIPFSWNHMIAALLFFPLFYYGIELIDKYTPNPKAIVEDIEESKGEGGSGSSFGSSSAGSGLGGSGSSGFGDLGSGSGDLGGGKDNKGGLDDFKL